MLAFATFLRIIFAVLQKRFHENYGKFREFNEGSFGGSEKDRYFLKILKWQHKLVRVYKRGKLVPCFLINVAKTYLYVLKISGDIEIFQSKAFFHLSVFKDIFFTSCLSRFKDIRNLLRLERKLKQLKIEYLEILRTFLSMKKKK